VYRRIKGFDQEMSVDPPKAKGTNGCSAWMMAWCIPSLRSRQDTKGAVLKVDLVGWTLKVRGGRKDLRIERQQDLEQARSTRCVRSSSPIASAKNGSNWVG